MTHFDHKQPGEVVERTAARADFDRWANRLREAQAARDRAEGRGGAGGGVRWWALMPDALRVYLLSTICDDDWERYTGTPWDSLPEGLRSALAAECRAISRAVAGCPWR